MRASSRWLLVLALATPLAACTVGDITGGGGGDDTGDDVGGDPTTAPDAAPPPDYALSMSPPMIATTLGTESRYTLTLTSDRYAGPVDLVVTGMPASWTVTMEPAEVSLSYDGTATVDLIVTVPTNGEAGAAAIAVEATAGPGVRTTSGLIEVENKLIVTIPAGAGTGPHQFPGRIDLKLGAVLSIVNGDTIGHRVHSDGGAGFPHQPATMGPGAAYTVTPGDLGQYRFYCHDHGEGRGVTNLVVGP